MIDSGLVGSTDWIDSGWVGSTDLIDSGLVGSTDLIDSALVGSTDFWEGCRESADPQGSPTQSHVSPSILVYEE